MKGGRVSSCCRHTMMAAAQLDVSSGGGGSGGSRRATSSAATKAAANSFDSDVAVIAVDWLFAGNRGRRVLSSERKCSCSLNGALQ